MPDAWDTEKMQGLKVLLVDDHRDAAMAMARLLQEFGCRTDVCFDGTSALARAQAERPEVVILDVRLPDLPGTEVCRRLRSSPETAGMLLIALTGAADDATLQSVRLAGFDCTLTKPVSLDAVLNALCGARAAD